jgi:hypothetical protein
MWSYHQWFRYQFITLPLWERTHCSPWYASKYHYIYHTIKWSARTKRGFSPFPHHSHRWVDIVIIRNNFRIVADVHCWSDSYKFDAMCFDNDNACSNNCCLRQGMILHRTNMKRWFHSFCHKDLQLFPSSFWFLFYFLCTCQYSSTSINLFSTFNVYILL